MSRNFDVMGTQKHIVVVLGMHRSGTSALTRALKVMGVELGTNLLPPMPGVNEKGFWEDVDINALNIELLGLLGHDWHTLSPIFAEDLESSALSDLKLKAIDVLRKKLATTQCFGMKDPRMARLLPFWQSVFTHINAHTSYVISCRNPMSVARSLNARDGFALEKGYLLWQEHMLNSLTWTENCPRLVVDYDCFLDDPAKEMNRISQSLGLSFNPKSADFLEFDGEFLERALRHTQFLEEDLLLDQLVPAAVVELYKALVSLAKDHLAFEDSTVKVSISLLNKQLRDTRVLLGYIRKNEDFVSKLVASESEKNAQLASLNKIICERDSVLSTLNCGIQERDEQVVGLKKGLCDREEQISVLGDLVAERDGQITTLSNLVVERDDQIITLGNLAVERDNQITTLSNLVVEQDSQITMLNNLVAERDELAAGMGRALNELQEQLTGLSDLIAERDKEVVSLGQENDDLSSQLSALNDAVSARDEQIVRFNEDVASFDKQLAALHQTLAIRTGQFGNAYQTLIDRDEHLAELYEKLAAGEEENRTLKSYIDVFKVEAEKLANSVIEKDALNESVSQSLESRIAKQLELEASLAQLRQECSQKDSELKFMSDKESIKQQQLLEKDSEVAKLLSSHSWRLTKPFRFIRRAFDVKNRCLKAAGRVRAIGLLVKKTKPQYIVKGLKLLCKFELRDLRARMRVIANRERNYSARVDFDLGDTVGYIPAAMEMTRSVDIIIPIYNGYEYLEPLFDSVLAGTNSPYRVILVNDASPDERVSGLIESYQSRFPSCLLLSNEENLGFCQTVNKAVGYTAGDFVLLNTDTEVPNGWLERLMAPMLEDRSIASATPFTNAGTICSFPEFCADNPIFMGLPVGEVDKEFQRISPIAPLVKIPTGVGFCMAFNGDVVKAIGMFDAVAYGRGYAEENDWCMRAATAGHTHVLVTNLFVYHKHGGSFSSVEKKKLIERNLATLQLRYPQYNTLVHQHISTDPAGWVRDMVEFNIMTRSSGVKALLIVDHNIGGGANQYSEKLKDSYLRNCLPVIFFCDDATTGEMFIRLTFGDFDKKIFFGGLQDIKSALLLLDIGEGFYNEAVSHREPEKSLQLFLDVLKEKQAALQVAMHDFYPVCPSYTLLNDRGVYCGVPDDIESCKKCIANNNADFLHEGVNIVAWRSFWSELFSYCTGIICFSENTKAILLKAYSDFEDKISVVPHEINASFVSKPIIDFSQKLHIGVVGGINYQKGLKVVTDIAKDIRRKNLDIKITVVGVVDAVTPIEGLNVTGPYKHSDLPEIFEKNNINVALFPSVWPETFSYVTAELMELDIPLACFDLGAPAERVSQYERGLILGSMDSENIINELSEFYKKIKNESAFLV